MVELAEPGLALAETKMGRYSVSSRRLWPSSSRAPSEVHTVSEQTKQWRLESPTSRVPEVLFALNRHGQSVRTRLGMGFRGRR